MARIGVFVVFVLSWVPSLWASDGPKLVIVIDDMGLSDEAMHTLADMKPLTLSFLPYADDLAAQTHAMRSAGHELLVHLPMEPKNTSADPGPNALYGNLSMQELTARIDWNLARFGNFVGVNNHMGSRLTEIPAPMVRVMTALKERNLLFLDSLTSPNSLGERAARAVGVSYLGRDIFLDNVREKGAILVQLQKALGIAERRGLAVAIGHPYSVTLETIEAWRSDAESLGVEIIGAQEAIEFQAAENQAR